VCVCVCEREREREREREDWGLNSGLQACKADIPPILLFGLVLQAS
jgi:hypothetical protein